MITISLMTTIKDGSNVDGDIDDHFIPPLEIYDPINRDNFDAKTKYFN